MDRISPRKLLQVLTVAAAAILLASLMFTRESGGQTTTAAARHPAPDIRFPTLDGKAWRLSEHRGDVVVVNFWATWCPPCRMETPGLVDLSNQYRNRGLSIVGISMDEGGAGPVREFIESYRVPYPILMPTAETPFTASIESLPTTLLIDRQGRVANVYTGLVSESAFRRDIDRLLAE